MAGAADPWADWLLRGRGGGSAEYESRIEARVGQYVERVLDALEPAPSGQLLDFGCGSGALGLRALRRWPGVRVVFADASEELLRIAGERARAQGAQARCRLLALAAREPQAGALHELADASVDAVATRSALAYVADKPAMLAEFRRVLHPGGLLSLGEPVFRDDALAACAQRRALEQVPRPEGAAGGQPQLLRLLQRWQSRQFPDTEQELARSPYCNFSERELFAWTLQAGFARVHVELHLDAGPSLAPDWDSFTRHSPHPYAKTLREVLDRDFTPEERALLEGVLRENWERGSMVSVERMAYVRALRP
jgi:arsenite methyltransferase